MFRKTVFAIDDHCPCIGYTEGHLWNGWATPYFPFDEAVRVMDDFNKFAEFPIRYNEETDAFILYDEGIEDYEIWKGYDHPTEEGIKRLYSIGAFSWVWDEWSAKEIAKIVRFLLEDYEIELPNETIRRPLEDVIIRRQVMALLDSDETAEFKIAKIGVLLNV